MSKYIMRIEKGPDYNGETDGDGHAEGIECDGYVYITFKGERATNTAFMNISLDTLRKFLTSEESIAINIRAGAALAEADIKAHNLFRKSEEMEFKKRMRDILSKDD